MGIKKDSGSSQGNEQKAWGHVCGDAGSLSIKLPGYMKQVVNMNRGSWAL